MRAFNGEKRRGTVTFQALPRPITAQPDCRHKPHGLPFGEGYRTERCGDDWLVIHMTGSTGRIVSRHGSEQDAERRIRWLLGMGDFSNVAADTNGG